MVWKAGNLEEFIIFFNLVIKAPIVSLPFISLILTGFLPNILIYHHYLLSYHRKDFAKLFFYCYALAFHQFQHLLFLLYQIIQSRFDYNIYINKLFQLNQLFDVSLRKFHNFFWVEKQMSGFHDFSPFLRQITADNWWI